MLRGNVSNFSRPLPDTPQIYVPFTSKTFPAAAPANVGSLCSWNSVKSHIEQITLFVDECCFTWQMEILCKMEILYQMEILCRMEIIVRWRYFIR